MILFPQMTRENNVNHQDVQFCGFFTVLLLFCSLSSVQHPTYRWVMPASETHPRLKIFERLGEDDVEDGMRPTALLVHVGGGNSPGLVAL